MCFVSLMLIVSNPKIKVSKLYGTCHTNKMIKTCYINDHGS